MASAAAEVSLEPKEPDAPERIGLTAGRSGLQHWAGYLTEEFLPELRGIRGYRIYDEMRRNEPTVAASLTAMTMVIGSVDWEAVPGEAGKRSDLPEDLAAADFINKAKGRINRPFDSIMADVLTMLPFGWALFEVTYKLEDGKVWWAGIDFRGQDTLYIWEFDEHSRWTAFIQRPAPSYKEIRLPRIKCLLFRTSMEKDNPEGLSLLRAAYKPYFYKRTIEEVEAMGAERDLLGLPVMSVPFGATTEERDAAQSIVENIKNDDQAGVVLTAVGPNPEDKFDLKLLTGQGSSGRVGYTDKLISRYSNELAMVFLAQFLRLGAAGQGGYNLSSDQRDLFQIALRGWLGRIADVWNTEAIPALLRMNGMRGKCFLQHGRVSQLNLQVIANFLTSGVQNKWLTSDETLERFLRQEAELPPPDPKPAAGAAPPAPAPPGPQGVASGPEKPPGDNSGTNANPGDNQRGGMFTPATAGGKVAAGPKAASWTDDPFDSEIWDDYAERTLFAMSEEL